MDKDAISKDVDLDVSSAPSTVSGEASADTYDSPKLKRAYRKLDVRLLLWYSFVYLVLQIHKTNITNTAIINIEDGTDIKHQLGGLTSEQWAWNLSIFYYPYAAFEPVSTLLLKRFNPSVWMSRIMVTWGIISICQGAVQNYSGLLATRFLLGLAEAGFYPGVLYHFSFWYPTDRMALRIAFFYACGQFSGTISGLLAFAISYMNGVGGLAAWRWVFILEGIPAVLCGIVTWFTLPNYPETARFLTPEESLAVVAAIPRTQPHARAKTWSWQQAKAFFTDPTCVTFLLLWTCHGVGGWGVSKILPNVIYDLDLAGSAVSQLMTMPTYAFGFASLILIGWLIERKFMRSWIAAIALEGFACICYIVLITVKSPVVKYIFLTLALSCGICVYPVLWPERIKAAHGTTTAGLAIGLTNAAAQLMGILGPQLYQSRFGPSYRVPFAGSIGLLTGAICFMLMSWWLLRRRERKEVETPEGELCPRVSEHESTQSGSMGKV